MELVPEVYVGLLCIGILNICIAVYALYYYTTKTPDSRGYTLTPTDVPLDLMPHT